MRQEGVWSFRESVLDLWRSRSVKLNHDYFFAGWASYQLLIVYRRCYFRPHYFYAIAFWFLYSTVYPQAVDNMKQSKHNIVPICHQIFCPKDAASKSADIYLTGHVVSPGTIQMTDFFDISDQNSQHFHNMLECCLAT